MEIISYLAIPLSILLGFLFAQWRIQSKIGNANARAEKIISDANKEIEISKKDFEQQKLENKIKLQAELAQKKNEAEAEILEKREQVHKEELKLKDKENSIKSKEGHLNKKTKELRNKEKDLNEQKGSLEEKKEKVDELLKKQIKKLEEISSLSKDMAIKELKETLINQAKDEVAGIIKQIKDEAREEGDKEAKEIIVSAIQRSAVDHSSDTTVSVVNIDNDDIKGRIIGREGRNIRSFEQATGIELIVDDTPGAVVISGFDPFRREIAKNALEMLLEDGRIHPGRIEEVVNRSKKDMDKHIKEIGQDTCLELSLHNVPMELQKLIGRLKYRTSYGQNVLLHSIEVAKLCGIMAADLGYDQKLAVRAGLLHDIGKAIDQYQEGTHVELGLEIAKKYKEHKIVVNAIASHHEDYPVQHPISSLVMAADAISSSRPGARRETLGNYLQRLEKLESMANQYEGVTKSYAIQAGREIRVMVENEQINDDRADMLASDIAEKIQAEMKYPGHIKVTVIREYRAYGLAK